MGWTFRRYAQSVHAHVSTNERTSFQSRTLVLDCWPRNGVSAHVGLIFLKEAHLGDSGPSLERVREFCEYLAHEHTDQETRIRPQCARFAIRARSWSFCRKQCGRLQVRLEAVPGTCVCLRQDNRTQSRSVCWVMSAFDVNHVHMRAPASVYSTAPEAQMRLRWGSNEAPSHMAWKGALFGVSGAPPSIFHRTQPPSWPIGEWTAPSPDLFSERAAEAGTQRDGCSSLFNPSRKIDKSTG